jgi:hypothetical protein
MNPAIRPVETGVPAGKNPAGSGDQYGINTGSIRVSSAMIPYSYRNKTFAHNPQGLVKK